ncbi:hypothetical protein L1987_45018 [Smallanthus sonchifolius]|uniref:Uncharacterized protein n=1 Tax=Smallanthus sonchifolius TaxID=185202 RepID=A0ACB9GT73_9ASTR|nr:hypothetical protein L1987_45018 [Smallanthus sonchifolius]
MESVKTNTGKKNFLAKTWKRCRSFPHSRSRSRVGGLAKSKSWNGEEEKKKMTPEGFFPVYVGPEKQRFAVKTKYVNHPLFTMLLEDAEAEYGYNSDGPILLPCDVDLFYKVMAEMEAKDLQPLGWSFAYGSCSPFNPSRRLGINGADQMGKGYGSYEALKPWSLIKMN